MPIKRKKKTTKKEKRRDSLISSKTYILLYLILAIAIGFGLFLPLMENDSAQHATMAMKMAKSHDYFNILKGNSPYLDKPHMHFWLSAFSFEIFGFEVWAYRIPAILLTLLGGFSCYKLTNLLYKNKESAKLAALMFLTSQTIILSIHDVRTDAVLTAFTILATWQWTKFLINKSLLGAILGGFFTAFAYSTKGIIAIAIIGAFLFFLVLIRNYWRRLINYKLAFGLVAFFAGSLPMFYAYYHQFGTDGIEFITFGQATGRFSGDDFGGANKNDYAFYFHTMLWTFLPWSLWFYYTLFLKGKETIKNKKFYGLAPLLTVLLFVIAMNFSSFKLPHYMNMIIPFTAIFTAHSVVKYFKKEGSNIPKVFQITQYIIAILGLLLLGFLAVFVFPLEQIPVILIILFSLLLIIYLFLSSKTQLNRTIVISAGFILITNIYLNSTFYTKLLTYQSGHKLSQAIQQNNIQPKDLYVVDGESSWAIDWNIGETTQKIERKDVTKLNKPFWAILKNTNPNNLKGNKFKINKSYHANHYRITLLKWDFLNPLSREEVLEDAWLIQYIPADK